MLHPTCCQAFRVDREIPLENAKDCYGRAVALEPSLRVTFAVKVIFGKGSPCLRMPLG